MRVHSGDRASQSLEALGAAGYAIGEQIVVGADYDPRSDAGRRLLAHELAHVAQQRSQRGPPVVSCHPPTVKGGVETTEVSPEVAKLLESKNIPYAREVTFEVLDANGVPVMKGRMDYFFRDPRSGAAIVGEVKGIDLEALTTNQRVYVPMFEGEGASIRITSSKGGALNLPKGSVEVVRGENFVRIGRGNLKDFADALEQITTGKRVKFSFRDASGLRFFKDEAEFDAFLASKGITRTKVRPVKLTGTRTAPPAPTGKRPAGTTGPESAPGVARPAEPPPAVAEPAPKVAEKPTGGSKAGAAGGVVLAVAPLVLGYLHERARPGRVAERAKEQGYVPQGDRGDLLDRLGDVLFDPLGEGERSVPISARVNMAKWRQIARDWFGGHQPGDTVVYHWDYYRDSRDMYSRWFIYMLGVDGKWFIIAEGVDREGAYNFMRDLGSDARDFFSKYPSPYTVKPTSEIPPDINDVISPTVPDSAVERQMVYDESIA